VVACAHERIVLDARPDEPGHEDRGPFHLGRCRDDALAAVEV
jgi:hypothetical protein